MKILLLFSLIYSSYSYATEDLNNRCRVYSNILLNYKALVTFKNFEGKTAEKLRKMDLMTEGFCDQKMIQKIEAFVQDQKGQCEHLKKMGKKEFNQYLVDIMNEMDKNDRIQTLRDIRSKQNEIFRRELYQGALYNNYSICNRKKEGQYLDRVMHRTITSDNHQETCQNIIRNVNHIRNDFNDCN
jgi:hypothetical protein